jgi:hypothetical protein
MEWIGLALLPVLMCVVMMGGMALAAALGLRRMPKGPQGTPTPPDARRAPEPQPEPGPQDVAR